MAGAALHNPGLFAHSLYLDMREREERFHREAHPDDEASIRRLERVREDQNFLLEQIHGKDS